MVLMSIFLAGVFSFVFVAGSPEAGFASQPQVQWHVGLGTDYEEHVHEGHQTSDGGFIAIGHGHESDRADSPLDMLVVKIDADGNEQWQTRVGTPGQMDLGIAIAETENGYVAGGGLSVGGRQRRALVGLDPQGNVLWERTYSGAGAGAVRGIAVLDDGNLVVTGYTEAEEEGYLFLAEAQAFLLKTNDEGRSIWDRNLDGLQGTKVRLEPGGGFAVLSTAWTFQQGRDVLQAKVLRTNASGVTQWSGTFGDGNHVDIFDFDLTLDGGFVLGGHTTGYGATNWDCVMLRIDAAGDTMWAKRFGQPRGYDPAYIHDECYGVRSLSGGGFLLVGASGDEYRYSAQGHPTGSSDEWKVYVIRTDAAGAVESEAVFGDGADQGNNAGEFVSLTDDGCYMIFTDSDSAGSVAPNNFGFMKVCELCGNNSQDAGEQCDDGNQIDCDGCDSDCTLSTSCGNGIICGLEQCDDGNTLDGDCCSSTCSFSEIDTSCDDGNFCTAVDRCDGLGACGGIAAPADTCLVAGGGRLDIRNRAGVSRDQVLWEWKKGPEVTFSDFGSPGSEDGPSGLCLYLTEGGSSSLLASFAPSSEELCGGKPCWRASGNKKLLYKDRKGFHDGLQQVLLKPGEANRSRIKLKAGGAELPAISLPLNPSARVEAQWHSPTSTCWAATFEASASRNDPDRFLSRY
jgi:cysteine-rich repeat protein